MQPVGPACGALLRLLAAVLGARAAVEVGAGCGVSGLWLLRGMAPDAVLTSIHAEAEHQQLARRAYAEDGIPAHRTRLITGPALQVLPRLTDGAYDLMFCDGERTEYHAYLAEALRLLRGGGVVAFHGALPAGDGVARDPQGTAVRDLVRGLRDDPRVVPALLPVGAGLLVAVRR